MPEERRPAAIIQLYWREQIVIEEDAIFMAPIYLEVIEP